ncbi:MAG: hypothetical protein K8I65_04615, partial [Thermoanaerobaculia bacterium]|nr:hypothetical protein [Thermoanaerobaculia bacterium]
MRSRDGRRFAPILEARARKLDDGTIELSSPQPGAWRDGPELGALIGPGVRVGRLEVLGVLHDLIAPEGAAGIVASLPEGKRL